MGNKNREKSKSAKKQNDNKIEYIPTDVLGSYTGMANDGSPPVQDADDL